MSLCLDTWSHRVWTFVRMQKRHQRRTCNTAELDIIQFVLRSWWRSESCTEYWLWCAVLCVGADRTADVSTRRLGSECSLPWHVWIDSRVQSWYTGLSCYNKKLHLFVIQPWRFCVCVSGHNPVYRNDTKTGLETQSNLISCNLFWEVGEGVIRVQSTDFDVLFCMWVRTVRLTSRLDV